MFILEWIEFLEMSTKFLTNWPGNIFEVLTYSIYFRRIIIPRFTTPIDMDRILKSSNPMIRVFSPPHIMGYQIGFQNVEHIGISIYGYIFYADTYIYIHIWYQYMNIYTYMIWLYIYILYICIYLLYLLCISSVMSDRRFSQVFPGPPSWIPASHLRTGLTASMWR